MVGSWGKDTQRRPPVDVDVFFVMPPGEFARIEALDGNKQSRLLQEVKEALRPTYPQTDMRGDGQVVQISFNSLMVEVVPAFACGDQFLIPDTNDGGRWKTADPIAEIASIAGAAQVSVGNARQLMRMIKCWRDECNVPLDSFVIEQLVRHFMTNYEYRLESHFWYDWFVRDFFLYLLRHANGVLYMPGTYAAIPLGNGWVPRAEIARERAVNACAHEYNDFTILAGEEWQKIFGLKIPIHVL